MKTASSTPAETKDEGGPALGETIGFGDVRAPHRQLSPFAVPAPRVASKPPAAPPGVVQPAAPVRHPAPERREPLPLAATMGFADAPSPAPEPPVDAASATFAPTEMEGTAATIAQTDVSTLQPVAAGHATAPMGSVRTTVLPRVEWKGQTAALSTNPRPRFERLRALGVGGVGEVSLAHDHDIDRDVAIKRLHPQFNDTASLVRFAEEVRVAGKLEHPNIAPIHDVGIDESGQHYFLMKYVKGDTLETVIERLAAKDPVYLARYSFEARVEIFRGILRALQYAHAQGVIHRDIKPSNVMVGPFGEVVLMDWGIAKHVDRHDNVVDGAAPDASTPSTERARLFQTRHGSLLGTPAYMAPEQARGDTAAVDARSDIYSACVLFSELLTLEHHLAHLETVPAMITTVMEYDPTVADTIRASARSGAPIEYLHLVRHGMALNPAARFQTVAEILDRVHAIEDGHVPIECPVTLMKRVGGESLRFVDRRPMVSMAGALAAVSAAVVGIVLAVTHLVPHLVR